MDYLPYDAAAKLGMEEKFFINVRKAVIPKLIKAGKLQGKKVQGKDCVLIDDDFLRVMQSGIERFVLNRQGFSFTAFQAPIEKVAAVLKRRMDLVLGYMESVRPVKPTRDSGVTSSADRRDCFLIQSRGTNWCVLVQTVHWSEFVDTVMSIHLAASLSAELKTQAVAVWDDDTSGSVLLHCDKGRKKRGLSTEADETEDFYGFFYEQGIRLDKCFVVSDEVSAQLEVDDQKSLERVDHVVLKVPADGEAREAMGEAEEEGGDLLTAVECAVNTLRKKVPVTPRKVAAKLSPAASKVQKKGLSKAEIKALFRKVEKGDAKAVKAWLKETDEVDVKGEFDWTPFLWAVRHQQTKLAELLLDAGADLNAKTSKKGYHHEYLGVNALMIAIYHNDDKTQEMLLKKGIDVEATDSVGESALVMALRYRRFQLAEKLLNLGLRVPEEHYTSALQFLLSGDYDEVVEMVVKAHPGIESCGYALVKAAWHGNLKLVKFLLIAGFDVNAVDAIEAGTALKAAACKGHDEVVKFLLANGADPNKIMKGGKTPLVWAKRCRNYKVITILKKVTK